MINIAGLDKAAVLAALYNASRPLGIGILHYDPAPMTPEQARGVIDERGDDGAAMFRSGGGSLRFDYLKGRVMKVNLSGDTFDEALYDRDNGSGAAFQALRDAGLLPSDAA